ncbi:hypothetical protein [Halobaculum marinum]|uniref:Tripartite tricarboxylate transporter TctB family protein n=1 Tax=Halobaculum marinum TaxID=3031996 RepID=A0ABD5WW37_9EURY|nr:hypothetical protein [Halobaculum sp. DT55]
MAEIRDAASIPTVVGLGAGFAVLGGLLTFAYVQGGYYPDALAVPRGVVMAAVVVGGVCLSGLRIRLRHSIEALLVAIPLSLVVYVTFLLLPQLLAGWSFDLLSLYFTYGTGGRGIAAWVVTFPLPFVFGFATHLVGDELLN